MASNLEIKIKLLMEGLERLQQLRRELIELAKNAQGVATGAEAASGALNDMAAAVKNTASGVKDTVKAVSDADSAMAGVVKSSKDAAVSMQDTAKAGQDAAKGMQNVSTAGQDAAKGMQDTASAGQDAAKGLNAAGDSANSQAKKFQALLQGLEVLGGHFDGLIRELAGVKDDLNKAGEGSSSLLSKFRGLTGGSKNLSDALSNVVINLTKLTTSSSAGTAAAGALTASLKPLLAGLLAIAGIKITFDYLKEAANLAARAETLGITLNVVGENSGYAKSELAALEVQLKKTGISTIAARDGMIQMMQAGLDLGTASQGAEAQIVKLARAAQDLAVVTGENSSETLQRLITNISQLDTVGLRFMGLTVDVTAAQEKFAAAIGTSVGALTEAQKRQAVANEVLAQAAKLSGAYEFALESVGKKLGSMKRFVEELQISLGNKLLPAYGALVDAGTALLKSLASIAEGFDKSGEISRSFGQGLKAVLDPLASIIPRIFEWVLNLGGAFAPIFKAASEAIGVLLDVFSDLLKVLGAAKDHFGILSGSLELVEGLLKAVSDGFKIFGAAINFTISGIATLAAAISGPLASAAEAVGFDDIAKKLRGIEADMVSLAKTTGDKMMAVTNEFASGESAIQKWWNELNVGKKELAKLDPTPAQVLKDEIIKLTGEQNRNTKSSIEVAAEMDRLSKKLLEAKDSGAITEKEFAKLSLQLGQVEKKMRDDLDAAFKTLKTSASELATGVSENTATIVGALKQIAENGLATAEQFSSAFGKNLSIAKNIEELQQFGSLLAEAKNRWPEATVDFNDALAQVSLRFDEVYEKQLKALSSRQEWDTLREAIIKMGQDGALSAGEVAVALEKGEQTVRKLSPAFIEASQASDKLGTAIAEVDIELEKLDEAIDITAQKASEAYSRMADGYQQLADDVRADTEQQIKAIDERYQEELRYIDTTVTNAAEAEQRKVQALLDAIHRKNAALDEGFQKELQFQQKAIEAERAALQTKLAALDTEVAKVGEALGKQKTSREEYERRLKDLDLERQNAIKDSEDRIRQIKLNTLEALKSKYQAHIDSLIAEEERLANRIKSLEEEKAQAKMSLEERIRAIQKSAMSEYEAYQATMTDVSELQAKAREAHARGEYEQAREYLRQAKAAAAELNHEVREGEKVYVSKQKAAEIAQNKLREVFNTELELLSKEQEGLEVTRNKIIQSVASTEAEVEKLNNEIEKVKETARSETKLNIQVNTDAAKEKLQELDALVKNKERLMPIKADLEQAQQALEKLKQDIAAGRTVKIDGDVSKAMESLRALKQYAEQTNNVQLAMDVSAAMAAIDSTRAAVDSLNSVKAAPSVTVDVSGDGKLSGLEQQLTRLKEMGQVDTVAEFQAKNEDKLDQYIYKVTFLDGKVTYSDHSLNIADVEDKAKKIEVIHKELGTKKTISSHEIKVNDEEAARRISEVHKAWADKQTQSRHIVEANTDEAAKKLAEVMKQLPDVKSTHNIETNAPEQKTKIDEATTPKNVTSRVNIETNADEQKVKIDKATEQKNTTNTVTIDTNASEKQATIQQVMEPKTVTSQHNIETNAATVKPQIDEVLTQRNVTSTHNITTDADVAKGQLDSVLEPKQVTSTHNVTTDASEVKPQLDSVLEPKDVTSTHNITTDASSKKEEIDSVLTERTVNSTHNVTTDASSKKVEIDDALQEREVNSTHNIETNAGAKKKEIDQALEQKDISSSHSIETNASTVVNEIQQLSNVTTQSQHTITHNVPDVLGQIMSLNGRNTSSVHTVYVVKQYLFGGGGEVFVSPLNPPKGGNDVPRVFANGGPVTAVQRFADGGQVHPSPQQNYPRQTSGVVPGVGNYDKVPRTLDVGSFVLKKSAVQKHGVSRILSLLEKAKSLPKKASAPVGEVPALLMPGEIVVPKDTVSRLGTGLLSILNGDVKVPNIPTLPLKFADGGPVVFDVPNFLTPNIQFGFVGYAFEKGGSVPSSSENVMRVDLRTNNHRATVSATQDQSKNLLELLNELRSRAL